ncbi:type II secretion system secretin GspD [Sphingomicrobium astaxanthinifaciens]|uniref:type II secretion system secretin GspD n=1 Tax=Sphingomicrobium astaxanthinifaciens TaxID=1227949 RepID=UPI001FCBFF47|nr:type II secretion system secretin GspD [Sphingomicrobium astaxanthinifaciens]MCJ7421070.1 type II secretion system secretin GspD [Sphingomicrobium astaxanthinifaciens]
MKRIVLLTAACLMAAAPTVASAQYMLNFREADVRAFVDDAARVTGLTFVVDSRVNQTISVVTNRSLSRSEYFEVFLATLRANGLVAIPIPGGYRIQPVQGAATQPTGGLRGAARNQFVTEIFRLQSIEAAGAIESLRPLVSSDGSITANRNANSIIVADYADNVARIRGLLGRIDTDTSATDIVYLQNAGAREVAEALAGLGEGGEGLAPPVQVSAIDSANGLALRGPAESVARFAALARELDAQAAGGSDIRIYWLEHADAEQLLPVLQQLLGQPVSAAASEPGFLRGQAGEGTGAGPAQPPAPPPPVTTAATRDNGIARYGPAVVTRYSGTNAIIIAANPTVQRQIGEIVRQLDTRREQVLVEAIIVEIGDNAARQLGVQFLLAGENSPFLAANYSNAQPNILAIGGAVANYELGRETSVNADGVVTSTFDNPLGEAVNEAAAASVLSATGGFAGGVVDLAGNALFGAIVNAVESDTDSNILSTPSILTLDNQEARLLVGQEVPVTTGEALSTNFDNAFRTVERQNVGIQLDVKPQVNSSGSIKLFIRQEVSSVAGPVSQGSADLVINKREFKTVLTVDDGEILAIGGLLDENERNTIEKIPLLGDIPLLGELFKSRSRARAKTNLMVFIRPTIIRDAGEARRMTARRYDYMRSAQWYADPGREPALDTLVRDYLGAAPPQPAPLGPGDRFYRPPAVVDVPPSASAEPDQDAP